MPALFGDKFSIPALYHIANDKWMRIDEASMRWKFLSNANNKHGS